MASSVAEFWSLVEQSRLLAREQCQQFDREFRSTNGATNHASPHALADWLVARNIFSRYQATVLLAGQPGPFAYGAYKIYDRVESGRLANEFRAVHGTTGHPVLLRFLAGPIVQDARLWTAAVAEAQRACALTDPHVQRYFELVDLGSFKFIVSEDLHGETLAERLAAVRLPPPEAFRLARSMAQGLAALHAAGRAHGDVRPPNVWLEGFSQQYPGSVKLLRDPLLPPMPVNFAAPDPHGWLLAQSDYLAPEFQVPGKTPDVLTDLYALGCTLYHMLAGHPPFPGGNLMQKIQRHSAEAIRPLETYGVPQPCAQLVMFLMAKNPALRYQDAQTVADQLAAFLDPSQLRLPEPAPLPTLGAFEGALRSSVQQAPRGAPNAPHVGEHVPSAAASVGTASVVRAAEAPTGNIPKGKAIAPATAAAKGEPTKIFEPAPLDPQLLAAKEAQQRKKLVLALAGVGVAAILLIVGLNLWGRRSPSEPLENMAQNTADVTPADEPAPDHPPEPEATVPVAADAAAESSATSSGPAAIAVVPDDGKLLWASPTSGAPIDLQYVPPLARAFVVVRGADLLATPEGPKVLQALGPQFAALRDRWEQAAGIKLDDCEQLIVSLHDNNNQYPKVSVVARLKEPVPLDDLPARWGNPQPSKAGEETVYTGGGWSYYAPASEQGAVFLMVPDAAAANEVIAAPHSFLKREMEMMRRTTDDQRHITLLYDPTFLFSGEGEPLFSGELARAQEPLAWLLGEGLQAASVSLHLGETCYFEMRSQTKVDKRPAELADDFRKRLAQVPENLTNYFVELLNPPPYWKKLSFKFPGMVEQLHDQMRIGVEENQAVVNAVLPKVAAHNLVLGAELTLATAPGTAVAATPAASSGPKTLEEALNLKIKSFAFDSLPFENAMRDLATDVQERLQGSPVEFSILVIGKDLEAGSVTRNKSVANFNEQDKTVAEVLTALVMKANPTVVSNASDPEQTLVWLVGVDPADTKKKIIITTRPGAIARGYTLPGVFMPK
jgi:serine/threonine protein kinase